MDRTKTDIRKSWMLIMMLDQKQRTQDDFIEELMYIGHFINLSQTSVGSLQLYAKFLNGTMKLNSNQLEEEQKNKKALKKAVSEILNRLIGDGIIKKSIKKVNRPGRNPG